jgi:hypothetical protein
MFLRNVGVYRRVHRASRPRSTSTSSPPEILKSQWHCRLHSVLTAPRFSLTDNVRAFIRNFEQHWIFYCYRTFVSQGVQRHYSRITEKIFLLFIYALNLWDGKCFYYVLLSALAFFFHVTLFLSLGTPSSNFTSLFSFLYHVLCLSFMSK